MVMNPFVGINSIEGLNKDNGMIYIIRSILSASLFLFAFMASSSTAAASDVARYDAQESFVFDDVMDSVVAANDVAVSRFSFDDGHRVTRAETLIGEAFKKGQCR